MLSPLGYVGLFGRRRRHRRRDILIYYVLLLIRGTRAVQILTGILVLLGLLGIATLFHLYLLGTILQLVVVGAAVTIPIVFQPELRRALEQIGRGGLFRMERERGELGRSRPEDRTVAISWAATASLLGRNRRGRVDRHRAAKRAQGLLRKRNLAARRRFRGAFWRRSSPLTLLLHDGAVVIREGRIEAAGRTLPLSEQARLITRLGTRHRAALGVSEETDAVVLVVSRNRREGHDRARRPSSLSRPIDDEQRA